MSSPFVDLDGTPISSTQILGYGRTGLVIRREDIAIKIPIRWSKDTDSDYQVNIETIHREQEVYQRIRECPGVVPCLGYSDKSIELALMENGDLRTTSLNSSLSLSLSLHHQSPTNSHGSVKWLAP